ncbi:histone H1.8 [Eulemur rufifrons]|uniref:histone H1.8 n=1 Tax=Eulemur rufifrons TaxID=859984 RepID=UPI003743509C
MVASGGITGETSTSSTSMAGSTGPPGSEKPGQSTIQMGRRNPPTLHMVLEALQEGEQRRGMSVVAIKSYILHKYPTVDITRFKYLLKQALATGMHRGLLTRPLNSKAKGATGSFRLVPKHKRKIRPRRTAASVAPRGAGEVKEKVPKKPSTAKKGPPSLGKVEKAAEKPGEVRKEPPKPCAAKQKAPKKGNKVKDIKAKLAEATKAPPKPDKTTRAPSNASRLSKKSKVEGSRNGQGDAEAHRKIKSESKSSRPTVSKGKTGAAPPARKKTVAKAPQGAAAQGSREGPNARAAFPAKGSGSKMAPAHLAMKTEAPMGPRKPGQPVKAAASKVLSKRAEA